MWINLKFNYYLIVKTSFIIVEKFINNNFNFIGTFRFGKVDVTEAQITIITAHVITSIFGDQIWHLKVKNIEKILISFVFYLFEKVLY